MNCLNALEKGVRPSGIFGCLSLIITIAVAVAVAVACRPRAIRAPVRRTYLRRGRTRPPAPILWRGWLCVPGRAWSPG
ncbi:Vmc-like lipoprotein signal peptide domain-containing protein [Propionibacterium freudenreichii]|uniref:Vmc-like lipoprotein signal peptide domain-containing protein n=1 Tax=Propionibacterium freudenreichii TaxID=1744 RepID=UPI003853ED45